MVVDPVEHLGQPGTRIDVVEFGGDDERVHGCGTLATTIGTGEQPALPAESNHPFILPMSGKSWKYIIRGIRFSDIRSLFGG